MALEVLDLFGVDQTLGGSIWSLPPERPVSRNRAGLVLLLCFLIYFIGGPHITIAVRDLISIPRPRRADIARGPMP